MSTATPRVEVHADAQELATAVAGELLRVISAAQESGRVPHVVLTGGTIAEAIHREIARLSPSSEVDWQRVAVWWGDERFVGRDSAERNAGQARAAFLDAVGVPEEQVHEMPSADDAATAEDAAASYAFALREHGPTAFDVVMLGVGPDGHVASLFPGFAQLDAADADVVAVHDSPKPPPERTTLTFTCLNRTRVTWMLVAGDGKAEAVARALAPEATTLEETPATGVAGREETVWFLDRAAASQL